MPNYNDKKKWRGKSYCTEKVGKRANRNLNKIMLSLNRLKGAKSTIAR